MVGLAITAHDGSRYHNPYQPIATSDIPPELRQRAFPWSMKPPDENMSESP